MDARLDATLWDGLMLAAATRCPYCDEPVPAGDEPLRCPMLGEVRCPFAEGPPGTPMDQTVAFGAEDEAEYPGLDALIDRTLGQYRIGAVIGRGTMGRVYRAEHQGLRRTCAVKVLNPGLLERQPQVVEQFWAEARAIAGLVHPHIVTVHNLGSERDLHYIEMEYVPGGVSLARVVVRDGPMGALRATTLVHQVVQALGAAHAAGLVHRDVKPANVLLAAGDRAKLADFGLVRRVQAEELAGGPVAGTPSFMAPELFAGAPAGPRSDLYAVGVMFYYLLTARLPFASDDLRQLIRLHRRATPADVRALVPELSEEIPPILARLLAKRPEERYDSAAALAEDLQVALFQMRDTEALIREGLEGLDCFVQQGGRDSFRVVFPVPGGRLQEVYVEVNEGRLGKRLLTVFSVCGPASADHYEFALRLNAELPVGGLSIREVAGEPMFVMTRTYPGALVTPAEVRAAVREIALRSDWVEEQLTRTDVF